MLKEISIINGPNLNLLGKREPDIYGNESMEQYIQRLSQKSFLSKIKLSYAQTNHEGALIDLLHEKSSSVIGIVLNAGAYTHTSLALADAIRSISIPVVEVHLSNIFTREKIRHRSLISAACKGSICGFGMTSYKLAAISLLSQISTLD
ncbi:type II 3-dehydroquinate dehydratase [Bacteroidetes bacterium endosymbiont of Geopemphigus sp.]|uniref:type II 3-dehydroquinate dehydratase n=1 Tax=Bacteroidetes bacterium endosymbiont of Geopemphigus sp. TaxID=2047937 RepID=UPI000CD1F015|nr:type II 3-dehydroquinate dehydratase [Bacteroidetes bacterium endosymbiont of Geopemphigus sp.]